MTLNITLDKNSRYIISSLENIGHTCFAVGGCVRDSIMGRVVFDYDLTTSAHPNEVLTLFSEHKTVKQGVRFGTVAVILDGKPYEITTFRKESDYKDSRHPDFVEFVDDIETDLSRRDFTVNAIAFCENRGVVDPFSGVEDIKSKIIRTVGSPDKRFSEDALRILRALRFASTLCFAVEEQTEKALFANSESIKTVSSERIFSELKKLLLGANAKEVLLKYREILANVIPINGDLSHFDGTPLDLAARFSLICGEETPQALDRLHADKKLKRACNEYLKNKSDL